MHSIQLSEKKRKNIIAAIMIFFIASLFFFWVLVEIVYNNERDTIESETQDLIEVVDKVVTDDLSVAELVMSMFGAPCDSELEANLNIIPANYTHIRSINLIRDSKVYCSSLLYNKNKTVEQLPHSFPEFRITTALVSTDTYILSLYMPFMNGDISVTSDISIIVNYMKKLKHSEYVALSINDRILTASGVFSGELEEPRFSQFTEFNNDSSFYTVAWEPLPLKRVLEIVFNSWRYMAAVFICALATTILGWLYITNRTSLRRQLAIAIKNNAIVPYYQPIICARTGNVVGAEILARWKHARAGFVSPNIFIPVAESTGMIVDLTESLLNKVANDIDKTTFVFEKGFKFNLNISHAHLVSASFYEFVAQYAQQFHERRVQLVFEITEREDIDISEDILNKIEYLKKHDVILSLDDFGTGFSNLAYISSLKPDNIKIDRMFIADIIKGENSPLIDCLIDMAQKMNIQVTAEGIEDEYQANYFKTRDIDLLQGFLFSPPLPFGQFIQLVQGGR